MNNNFYKDDPETIIHVRLLAWRNAFEKRKAFKKEMSRELILVALHPTRWWDWCMSENEKKEILLIKAVDNKMLLVRVGSL